ncbi:MAG: paraslipin [Spirochaetes bacterium]|nr:paraslipin [Spirochaetota bacterium]
MFLTLLPFFILGFFIIIMIFSIIKIIPHQMTYVIERLGKYNRTLEAGFHVLFPFIERVAYKHSLKEVCLDVPPQMCITKDNIAVEIDGILYFRIVDPAKASYGIKDYSFAIVQLSQTTMRSEIGKIELDKTFQSREDINSYIVSAVDEASDPWGIKVTRYEIKNIEPPESIKAAMEKQMRAEREKREAIALSEGDKLAKINRAEGDKQEAIMRSEGDRIRQENEAKGKSFAILEVAKSTALGIAEIAKALNQPGGQNAMNLKIATEWIQSFEKLAKETNSMIIPTDVSSIASITSILKNSYDFADVKQHLPDQKKQEKTK